MLNRVPCVSCVPAWSTCQRAKSVPTSHFYVKKCQYSCQPAKVPRHANYSTWHANVPSCQRSANYSTWRANMPKGVPIFQLLLAKGVPIFQLFFKRIFQLLNFSIILNICKFLEHLGNSREFTRKTNNLNFDICKKPKTH